MSWITFIPYSVTKNVTLNDKGNLTTLIVLDGKSNIDDKFPKDFSKENFEGISTSLVISSDRKKNKEPLGKIELWSKKTIAKVVESPARLSISAFCSKDQRDTFEREIYIWLNNKTNFSASFSIEYSGFKRDDNECVIHSSLQNFIDSKLFLDITHFQLILNSVSK